MTRPIRFAAMALMLVPPLAEPQDTHAGAILAQASPGPGQTKPAEAAPSAPLTGGAAWNALLDNTISGRTPDGPYTEFFKPDGTAIHLDRDGKDLGHWTLEEPSICFTYPDNEEKDCRKLQVEGTHGAFLDRDGSSYRFDILPGNPNHL